MDSRALPTFTGIALLIVLFVLAATGSCSVNTNSATRALNAMGIKDVHFGGYAWFACGKNDGFSSTFTGIGADGKSVSGAVCQGIFKNTTVRFD